MIPGIRRLVPGFGNGPGSPVGDMRAGERRRRRERRRELDEEYEAGRRDGPAPIDDVRDPDSPRYVSDDPAYHHHPGGASMWERAEKMGDIAPVMGNPSLDPANGSLVSVSYMAGYGDDAGFDAMQGVDRLVTGMADPAVYMDASLADGTSPLRVRRDESVYYDAQPWCTAYPYDHDGYVDHMDYLRLHEREPEAHGVRR